MEENNNINGTNYNNITNINNTSNIKGLFEYSKKLEDIK